MDDDLLNLQLLLPLLLLVIIAKDEANIQKQNKTGSGKPSETMQDKLKHCHPLTYLHDLQRHFLMVFMSAMSL